MVFPWFTLVMWLISFFTAKKKGMKTGKAIFLSSAVAGATYLIGDPANANNLLHIGVDAAAESAASQHKEASEDRVQELNSPDFHQDAPNSSEALKNLSSATTDQDATNALNAAITTAGGVVSSVVHDGADVVKTLGPAGTVGLVSGVKASSGLAEGASEAAKGVGGFFSNPQNVKIMLWGGLGILAFMALK